MKKFFKEFKAFITRGNVLDMAVGVIVGGAFTAIVNGLSNFILKPIVNFVIYKVLFWITKEEKGLSEIFTFLKRVDMVDAETGEVVLDSVTGLPVADLANSIYIDWGSFITAIINFILIALVLFCIVKFINKVREENREFVAGKISKEDKREMKKLGIKPRDKAAVAAYFEAKAKKEAEAKAAAEEKARLDREANPTAEDLLKKIVVLLENK